MSYGTTTMACSGLQFGCTYPPSINHSLTTSPQLLLSGTNLTQAAAAAAAVAAVTSSSSSSSTCCENGRPIVTDPCTGQSTCTCQIHPAILASYPRVPSLMDHLYNTAGLSPTSLLGAEPSAFYAPLKPSHTSGYDLERSAEAWKGLAAATVPSTCYTYDPAALAAHSYNNLYQNLDYNNATRRKNATRETTNALKAWLYEHRKNPYPTKGEKIMLAIITKMTLTQVSTWFANARRRLKKENKMTWTSKEKDDDMMQDKDDVLSHEPEDDLVNSRDENTREDSSSSYDEDERLDVSGLDEKDDDFSKCLPTAADMADSDVENERPPGVDIIKSSSPPPLQPPPLTINHSTPKAPAVSHSFYRYSSIIPRSSRCNFGISSDKQHPPKLIETELNTNGLRDNTNSNHEGFSPIPSDGGTKGSCSPAERTKSQPEVERSPSKTQGSVTVAVKPKIWSISNIMDSSSSSSSSSSVSSSSLSSGALNSCHPTLNGPHHKISGRLQIPSDHHLVANRPSILHYDSAMSRERMCALQIYLPSHELLPNAFNHSPAHADLASFRNLCVASNSNHPLETPPHTPPERQAGGSHFDVNCPQLSAPPIEVSSTMATAPSAKNLPLQAKLPPTQPSQSRDSNGLALVKSFNKIPK